MVKVKKLEKQCNCGATLQFNEKDILKDTRYKLKILETFIFYDYYIDLTYIKCPVCSEEIILTAVKNIELTKQLREYKIKQKTEKRKNNKFWRFIDSL